MRRWIVRLVPFALAALAACSGDPTAMDAEDSILPDAAIVLDLAPAPPDLTDLAPPLLPDLATPPDRSPPSDLTPPEDSTLSPDLAPDLATPPDLAIPPDLILPDLARPDLLLPDLATPDLVPLGPCGGVSINGQCLSATQIQICATVNGAPQVQTITCTAPYVCQVQSGAAGCVPDPNSCTQGATACVNGSTEKVCVNNTWQQRACAMCTDTGGAASCAPIQLQPISGVISYEMRAINQQMNDWTSITTKAPVNEALVVSYSFDSITSTYSPLDSTVVSSTGGYTIKVPVSPGTGDIVAVWALRTQSGGLNSPITFAVGLPDVPDGTWQVARPIPGGPNANYWVWTQATSGVISTPTFTIPESAASGALRVFDELRLVHDSIGAITGKAGLPVIAWLRYNTLWDFYQQPISFRNDNFASQLFFGGSQQDERWWSDAVNAHESSHWVMASYGHPPGEGGTHIVACTSFPGLAWSEGWATGMSSLTRRSPYYYDKQGGTFFWFDISQRHYWNNAPWTAPTPGGGLLQMMDENEISAILWAMADTSNPNDYLTPNSAYLGALSSMRLNSSPFARGYTRHTWNPVGSTCQDTNIVDTGQSAPMLADFLDALVCNGFATARVDAAVQPTTRYPYPSASPLCH